MMKGKADPRQSLAAAITKSASKQTYYTIRFFVDRQRVADAYRAYGYFRWVDDILDEQPGTQETKLALLHRQQALLEACYQREALLGLCAEGQVLAHLVAQDTEKNSGLQAYLRNMMAVMAFDARATWADHLPGRVVQLHEQPGCCGYRGNVLFHRS